MDSLQTLPRSLRRFAAKPPAERRRFVRTALMVLLVRAATRVLGVPRTQRLLAVGVTSATRADATLGAALAGRHLDTLATVARFGFTASCLTRSLLVCWELRRSGIDAAIRIGMKRKGEREAHAWVEVAGVPVTDAPEVVSQYAVFDRPLGDAARLW